MSADLRDKRILITAPLDSSERIAGLVRQRGGIPVIAPLIKRVPLPGGESLRNKLRALSSYRWIVFTSAGAVERFFDELESLQLRTENVPAAIVAIGERTRWRIERRGFSVDCVAQDSVAEGVVEAMAKQGLRSGDRVLFPCADNARSFIPEELQRRGVQVEVMELYTIAPDTPDNLDYIRAALDSSVIDAVTFTSPSAARRFFEIFSWQESLPRPVIAVIGPTTAAALCEAKVNDFVQAAQASAESMITALADYFCRCD
ncbi:hypothetical protein DCC62_28385 [candidate division KSB1 bacterium]|nr:MAG: hypothetical protein DCC62_28385 [candidate division KSB1 bacterium]